MIARAVLGAVVVAVLVALGCTPAGERTASGGAHVEGEISGETFGELFDIAKERAAAADEEGRTYDTPESFVDEVVKEAGDRQVDLEADDIVALRTALSCEPAGAPIADLVGQFENLADVESRGRTPADILRAYTASVQEALAEMIGAGADQPLPGNHVATPVLRQEENYSCGNNAALSELRFWRPDLFANVTEQDLYGPMKTTPENGTEPQDIASYMNGVPGLKAEYRTDVPIADLLAAVDRGQPPIVDIQAWQGDTGVANEEPWATAWEDGHYVVLTGYDDVNFTFMDPSMDPLADGTPRYAYIPRSEFVDRWHDLSGPDGAHVQRMVIFVSPTDPSLQPSPQVGASPQAAIMH